MTRDDSFVLFALMAKQAERVEKTATAFSQQRQALSAGETTGVLFALSSRALSWAEEAMAALAHTLKLGRGRGKERIPGLRAYCPNPSVVAFADATPGLGDAVFFFLGLLPKWIGEFATVSKLWAYCGLHVLPDGSAPRKGNLKGGGTPGDWSPYLKAIAIARLADPCVKCRQSPYRPLYDARRAHTAVTHPDWTDMHSHRDAMRVTAKAILKDLWRVSHDQLPVFGGNHGTNDNHLALEPTEHPAPPDGGGGHNVFDTHILNAPAAEPIWIQADVAIDPAVTWRM